MSTNNTPTAAISRKGFAFGSLITAAILGIAGFSIREEMKAEEVRRTLLGRVQQPLPATADCTLEAPRQQVVRMIAPLLNVQDVATGLSGQTLLAHALNNGVDIMLCDDMKSVTGQFEKSASGYALKLNVQAHDLQQQAATLQLLKEFYNAGPAYGTGAPQARDIIPDPHFVRSMPGAILQQEKVADHVSPRAPRFGVPVKIPMRQSLT